MEKYKKLPSQEDIKRLIHYDPETGVCTRRISNGPVRKGDIIYAAEQIKILGVKYIMARVIWKYMTGVDPQFIVDHENRDHWDHRWSNLREATRSQNCSNASLRVDNKSGIRGVGRYQWDQNRWCASVRKDGVQHCSPVFDTMDEAVQWRVTKAKELHGEFSND